tara:strand:- start:784 stop:888 length:105 start_codon:yes stop_codon:yes gene_type:complete
LFAPFYLLVVKNIIQNNYGKIMAVKSVVAVGKKN